MFGWIKSRRRKKLLAKPISPAWQALLEQNVWQYSYLDEQLQRRLADTTRILIAEKDWVGCGGVEIDDEIKVTIAAQAALMLLGSDPSYYFDGVLSILVYPSTYLLPAGRREGLLVRDEETPVLGEAWHRGPIILAWDSAREGGQSPNDGHNVVVHEFAHHLDGLDGFVDGSPPFPAEESSEEWTRIAGAEFRRLQRKAAVGEPTLLDPYGATSEAEFFAVASEAFFQRPTRLKRIHPDLYAMLQILYQQDLDELIASARSWD